MLQRGEYNRNKCARCHPSCLPWLSMNLRGPPLSLSHTLRDCARASGSAPAAASAAAAVASLSACGWMGMSTAAATRGCSSRRASSVRSRCSSCWRTGGREPSRDGKDEDEDEGALWCARSREQRFRMAAARAMATGRAIRPTRMAEDRMSSDGAPRLQCTRIKKHTRVNL